MIGIGETVLDILFKEDQPQKAVPGGSTFNSIVSLGRAGVNCAMVTEVGGDHIGDIICRYLQENGVSDEYVCRHEKVKSHISLAFLNEHNDAQYIFYNVTEVESRASSLALPRCSNVTESKDHASMSLDGPPPGLCAAGVAATPWRTVRSSQSVGAVAISSTRFQVTELGELAQITLGSGGGETELTDDSFGGELLFIGHKNQNIDQFIG